MRFLEALLRNHPFANVCFATVLVLGAVAYALLLPREQDPEINFNWVSIITILPGASAEDVERLVTDPLEEAIANVADVRFVSSSSREGASSILVRFREISERTFDKRINDLRREIQNRAVNELPPDARDPQILEITTSNGFPTATVVLAGQADDETLRANGRAIRSDLERIAGVDRVIASGLRDPELHVRYDPQRLAARGLRPTDVADAVAAWFRDTSAGSLRAGDAEWLVRVEGQAPDPSVLARIPVAPSGSRQEAAAAPLLQDVARVERARARPTQLTAYDGRPAISFAITKKGYTNTIELVERIGRYIDERNALLGASGLRLVLADDQTVATRQAIGVMQTNALQGLLLVIGVCWLFLGTRIALLVGIGIPFSILGTFALLYAAGSTLNVSVLLGVVIALGMIVDASVVVVESIYYRIERGVATLQACLEGIREIWQPVAASVATTVAAFLPLMLLPGIVGKFMFVIPFVVTVALAISLVAAFWMLPTHVLALRMRIDRGSRSQRLRIELNRRIRLIYGRLLAKAMRHPYLLLVAIVALIAGSAVAVVTERVRIQFFAFDPLRIYYVNVDMPPTASLQDTLAQVVQVEQRVRRHLRPDELRSITSVAGVKFTDTEPLYGDSYGQVIVSLQPADAESRSVQQVIDAMRADVLATPGPGRKSFLQLSGGPPLTKPINVKLRGDDYGELRAATDRMLQIVRGIPGTRDVVDDDVPGRPQLTLKPDREAIVNSGIGAAQLNRIVRLGVDGEVVSVLRAGGDKIEVRVQAAAVERDDVAALLQQPLALPGGGATSLSALLTHDTGRSKGIIRHYNLRRTITVEADLDREVIDTVRANQRVRADWEQVRTDYPGVSLEFAGELEDIEEALAAMPVLFLLGVGLIYLILAAQFRSYFQPLMILVTVPLAFTGVTVGLLLTGNPLSLYTMYGVIALTGIAVNAAIVLISAMNERLERGMPLTHATIGAARRRVVPVLITTLTTIAGLFALATGLGGTSLLWGPVASAIVWGLMVATLLTLFAVPLLYVLFMRRQARRLALRPESVPA
ncbi:MAG TPA: efflux RND transporter permease subunit, partial [Burkholderiaceae bacterium]|nr:efflux RND transporter permease subunit [Burkholderiaceae bacterium]